jgi:3'(2'), 5'-bisphosphate nucleotidase/myo-inositol-1(or 4)-monophosphatase
MHLNKTDLIALASLATTAAKKAGALIQSYLHKEVEVFFKPEYVNMSMSSQVVTEVDELSQAIILKHLLPTCADYDLALLSEEQVDDGSRFTKDAFWCIDPLDGTLPFTESIPGYAVSIALVARDGTPLIGVVYDPTTETLYQAVKGQGAQCNRQPWNLQPRAAATELHFIGDRSMAQHPQMNDAMQCLQSVAQHFDCSQVGTRLTGGATMNALWALEQAPACYFKFPKPQAGGGSLWDYAATACIYAELGAWCSDIHGQPLELNRTDSTFMNHHGVLYASDPELGMRLVAALKTI